MIASIHGILTEKAVDSAVIECGGIGFEVQVSTRTLASLPEIGAEAKLLTYFQVREDAMTLFGFLTADEKTMFTRLTAVTGVGPKMAMSVLSTMTVSELAAALVSGNAKALARVPGVGKRTAERLILELKERIDDSMLTGTEAVAAASAAPITDTPRQEAVEALISLGYSSSEASQAVNRVSKDHETTESIIFAALSALDRG